jgi:hypothetical protein
MELMRNAEDLVGLDRRFVLRGGCLYLLHHWCRTPTLRVFTVIHAFPQT